MFSAAGFKKSRHTGDACLYFSKIPCSNLPYGRHFLMEVMQWLMKQRKSVRNVKGKKLFPAHVNAIWSGEEPKSTACGTTASAIKKKSVLSAAVPGM